MGDLIEGTVDMVKSTTSMATEMVAGDMAEEAAGVRRSLNLMAMGPVVGETAGDVVRSTIERVLSTGSFLRGAVVL